MERAILKAILVIVLATLSVRAESPPQTAEALLVEREKEDARIKKWEPQIKGFEEQDAKSPPPSNAVLFVGSSSIRLWKLSDSFPELTTVNRGFGGSHLADSVHYTDRIIVKHKPRTVVLYAGDNDLANGKSPERVAADFEAFVSKVRAGLPDAKIVYIAIKPSIARWKLLDKVRDANRRIQSIAERHERVVFVDVDPAMLGSDARPRPELFVKDGLHMSPAGYQVWASLVAPHIKP